VVGQELVWWSCWCGRVFLFLFLISRSRSRLADRELVDLFPSLAAVDCSSRRLCVGYTAVFAKAGPVRALVVALRSRLFFNPELTSVRYEDAARLREMLEKTDDLKISHQAYIVVVGPKGIGKSVLIDFVLKRKAALVVVEVTAGTSSQQLLAQVHRAIGGHRLFGNSHGDAHRVLLFFKFFGARPTVILARARARRSDCVRQNSCCVAHVD
jgi:hypothetical protein